MKRKPKIPKTGFFWHVHHDELFEWCHNYDLRVEHILKKPSHEIKRRLRLFKPVQNVPRELKKLIKEFQNSGSNYAWWELEQWFKTYYPEMEALHKKECPRCPWNGKTLFPERTD